MRRTLLAAFGVLGLFAAVVVVGAWASWSDDDGQRERELEWLAALAAWIDVVEDRVYGGNLYPAANCDDSYAVDVGEPPERLEEADRIARLACRSLSRWVETEDDWPPLDWPDMRDAVITDLTEQRRYDGAATESEELKPYAVPLAGVDDPEVYCWELRDWEDLNEEWAVVESDEFWLAGFADADTGTIDLAPDVCESLHAFFGSDYAPTLNEESLDLASALVTLAHEAEHLRNPEAAEAAVECVAIQRVRDLVRAAGRGRPYGELMTGLAWDVGYPDMPDEYRTKQCRDGSKLDLRPETSVFP